MRPDHPHYPGRGPDGRHRRHARGPLRAIWESPVKRRTMFGVAAAGLAAGAWEWGRAGDAPGIAPPHAATDTDLPEPGRARSQLQITAHPDDDLYFYNLDTRHAIAAGHPMVTVCLTAGESNGRNGSNDEPADFQAFAAARQNGQRAAYAAIAGLDELTEWDRRAVTFDSGVTAEVATLTGGVDVTMIYLNMWEDSSKQDGSGGRRLMDLWTGATAEHHTIVPTGSPITEGSVFTREVLLATIAEILASCPAALVRTLDPDPDPQVHDEANPQYADQDGFSDHIDHTAAGLFAAAALRDLPSPDSGVGVLVQPYRGYYNRRWPRNLTKADREEKGGYLDIYSWKDDRDCGDPAGCGDRRVSGTGVGNSYGASTAWRYPGDTGWLRRDADGALSATSVHQGVLVCRRSPGEEPLSTWGTAAGPADGLLPVAHLYDRPGGDRYALAVSADYGPDADDQVRRLRIGAVGTDGTVADWDSLGNPDGDDPVARRGIGSPVATALPNGGLLVAARDFARRPAVRRADSDLEWGDWEHLDGPIIQDGLAIAGLADGRVDLFGCGADGIVQWRDGDGSTVTGLEPAAAPTYTALPGGGGLLLTREAKTAQIVGWFRDDPDADWTGPVRFGGDGGTGAVAAVAPDDWDGRIGLAARNGYGTTSVAVTTLPSDAGEVSVDWRYGGPLTASVPSLAIDRTGRMLAGALTPDAGLHIAVQDEPAGEAPDEWHAVAV